MSEKTLPTIQDIREITEQYTACKLECGGMSEVLHFYLCDADIEHTVYDGTVKNEKNARFFSPHMWIELVTQEGETIVDYRARMWLGSENRTPHGVFLKSSYPHMSYIGNKIELTPLASEHINYMLYHFGYDDVPPPAGLILIDPVTRQHVRNSRPLPYSTHNPYGRQRAFLPLIARKK